jgi:hypothetical protein
MAIEPADIATRPIVVNHAGVRRDFAMHTPRLLVFALILSTLTTVAAPAGSAPEAAGACGLAIHIHDPDIRARFEAFDRIQSAAAAKACAYYRNDMRAALASR